MPRPYHSSRFDYPNNIWWWVQVIKFLVMWSSPIPCRRGSGVEDVNWVRLSKVGENGGLLWTR
jgi:hypothetical protein